MKCRFVAAARPEVAPYRLSGSHHWRLFTYHSIVLPPSSVVVNDVDDVFVMSTGVAPSTPAKSEYCVAPSTVFQMNATLPAATLEPSLGVTSDGGSGQTTTLNRRVVESVGVHEAPTFARTNHV